MRILRSMLVMLACLAPLQAHASWKRATSDNFILYSEGSERDLRDLATELEKYRWLLSSQHGMAARTDPDKLTVFLLPSAQFHTLAGEGGKKIGGWYSASERGAYAVVERLDAATSYADVNEILFHEYAHHFMLRYFPATYPAWLVEGYAETNSTINFLKNGDFTVGEAAQGRWATLNNQGMMPLPQLFGIVPRKKNDEESFYATAWVLTHYLTVAGNRKGELDAYLKALAAGKPVAEAAQASFAGGLDALGRDVASYVRKQRYVYMTYKKGQVPDPAVTITEVPAAEAAMLPAEMMFLRGVRDKDSAEQVRFVKWAQAGVAAAPTSAVAQALLAEAYLSAEKPADAMQAADAAIAIDGANARALLVKAQLLMDRADSSKDDAAEAADRKSARSAILRANRSALGDIRPLVRYYDWYRATGKTPPSDAYVAIDAAFAAIPQDPALRYKYADALAMRERYKDAAAALAVLVNEPHGDAGPAAAMQKEYLCLANGAPCADAGGTKAKDDPAEAE